MDGQLAGRRLVLDARGMPAGRPGKPRARQRRMAKNSEMRGRRGEALRTVELVFILIFMEVWENRRMSETCRCLWPEAALPRVSHSHVLGGASGLAGI